MRHTQIDVTAALQKALDAKGDLILPATLYAEPQLTTADVAARLNVTLRQAQTLVKRHPAATRDLRWLLPERCLADLEARPGRGRPKSRPSPSGRATRETAPRR